MLRTTRILLPNRNLFVPHRYLSEWQKNRDHFLYIQQEQDPTITSPQRYNAFIRNDVEAEIAESKQDNHYDWTNEASQARYNLVQVEKPFSDKAERYEDRKNDQYIPYAMSFLPML